MVVGSKKLAAAVRRSNSVEVAVVSSKDFADCTDCDPDSNSVDGTAIVVDLTEFADID